MTKNKMPKYAPLSKWMKIIIHDSSKDFIKEFEMDGNEKLKVKIRAPKRKIHVRSKKKQCKETKLTLSSNSKESSKNKKSDFLNNNNQANNSNFSIKTCVIFSRRMERSVDTNGRQNMSNNEKKSCTDQYFVNFFDQSDSHCEETAEDDFFE